MITAENLNVFNIKTNMKLWYIYIYIKNLQNYPATKNTKVPPKQCLVSLLLKRQRMQQDLAKIIESKHLKDPAFHFVTNRASTNMTQNKV